MPKDFKELSQGGRGQVENYHNKAPNMLWVGTPNVISSHNKVPNMLYLSPNVIIDEPQTLWGINQYVIGNQPIRYGESTNMLRLCSKTL